MHSQRAKWWALIVLCMGTLMIVLDTTIVNVALPSIKTSLGFSDSSLAWVVNAYALTFAGFLLLGGRLGDLYGQRRFFLIGITLFTCASLACGLAGTQLFLITARAVQGVGGAVASAVALSLVMHMFTESNERARAMGVFGFVAAGGGAIGVFLGGVLTGAFNWHWIFLVNLPIGIAVFILSLFLVPRGHGSTHTHLDVAGAITVTASLMLAVYAIVGGNAAGWTSLPTLGALAIAVVLMVLFLLIESRVRSPLMPLSLFKLRNVAVANGVGILWSASMFSWFFISALFLQQILGYDPLHVGLSFLPANLIMAVFSIWLSAKAVMRFGIKTSLSSGLALCAAGLFLFAQAPESGGFLTVIVPAMMLMGLGAGLSFNPMLLAAMSDVPQDESGLASGVVNTAFMMGGALGLAILASIAAAETTHLMTLGAGQMSALSGGYRYAFIAGGFSAACAAALSGFGLRIAHARRT